jgi:hypothetical protein
MPDASSPGGTTETKKMVRRAAYHEAGHVVTADALGTEEITLSDVYADPGRTGPSATQPLFDPHEPPSGTEARSLDEAEIETLLAGRESERMAQERGRIDQATADVLDANAADDDARIRQLAIRLDMTVKRMEELRNRVRRRLDAEWDCVEMIAFGLMKEGELLTERCAYYLHPARMKRPYVPEDESGSEGSDL